MFCFGQKSMKKLILNESNINQVSQEVNYNSRLMEVPFKGICTYISKTNLSDEFELEFSGSSELEQWKFKADPIRAGAL